MLFPMLGHRTFGLIRRSAATWEAENDDPHIRFKLSRRTPRFVCLIVEGLDCTLEPSIYFDTGRGFSESEVVNIPRSGRVVLSLDRGEMAALRAFRLDPLESPGRLRLFAWATHSKLIARLLTKLAARKAGRFGPTRSIGLASPHPTDEDVRAGIFTRRYRDAAEHYADVLSQQRGLDCAATVAESPLISFLVPTYNTKVAYLDDLLQSFQGQIGIAELIFSDDGSSAAETLEWLEQKAKLSNVKVIFNRVNRGIAATTNAALESSTAPWVALIDHDDALSEGAITQISQALTEHPDALFLYTDEVIADENLTPKDYFLKPAYDPVLLSGVNYINHLSIFSRKRLQDIGGFRAGYEGSQDYDLLLRYLDGVSADRVLHLPYPAYVWRRHPSSFSTAFEEKAVVNARAALLDRFGRRNGVASVEPALLPSLHRLKMNAPSGGWPKISIIIPNRDSAILMDTILSGLASTNYPTFEVIIVDNDSSDRRVFEVYDAWRAKGLDLSVRNAPGAFNFSFSVNQGIAEASGELVLLLNNDIEVLEPDWLTEMAACFQYEDTGIVGARLLYPDGTIQHAGVIVGFGGLAGHWFGGARESTRGPMGRLAVRQSFSAVTGAAMLISRACLQAVGPFDEEIFAIAYNDIDFCLRARAAGFRVVWTPFATLTHHESKTRGSDAHPERITRFRREQQSLRDRHATRDFSDPAYNPWCTTDRTIPGLRALDALPKARYCTS